MTRVFNRKKDQEKRRRLRAKMTHAEVLLWSKLKNRQLLGERFLRQYGVDQYVLDFYCPRLKVAIEVDGVSHFAIGAKEYDEHRQQHIETYGIRFLRFTNTDISDNLDGVLKSIFQYVDEVEGQFPKKARARQNPPLIPPSSKGGIRPRGVRKTNVASIFG